MFKTSPGRLLLLIVALVFWYRFRLGLFADR